MEFTEKQMEKLVEDVRNQLSALLKGEATAETPVKSEAPAVELVKAEDCATAKKAEESSSLEKSGPAPAAHEPKERGPVAKATEESESSSSKVEKAYKEMSKSEREEHYKALKRFIWADQGFEIKKAEESTSEEKTVDKAEDSETEESKAKKAEESTSEEKTVDKAESVSKAEEELVSLKSENETLKKNVEQLIAGLNRVIVKAPDRKSVASLNEVVLKPGEGTDETLSEPALRERLNSLTKSEKLTSFERDVINGYVVNRMGRDKVLSIVKDKK